MNYTASSSVTVIILAANPLIWKAVTACVAHGYHYTTHAIAI